MENKMSYVDSLNLLKDNEWVRLSIQQKLAVMQSVENEVAHREGRPACNVSLFTEAPDKNENYTSGTYDIDTGKIGMNTYYLYTASPEDSLRTILHEGRHGYQDSAVKGIIHHHPQSEVNAWKHNMNHYIDGEKNIRAYYNQPVEADAREYADITTRQILAEQKNLKYTNKGLQSFSERSSETTNQSTISTNKGIQSFRDKLDGVVSDSTSPSQANGSGESSGSGQGR